jgi:hypothetical protein
VKTLPAFNGAAVEDFVCGFVDFVRLVSLYELLHVFRILFQGGAMPPFLLLGALPDLLFILVLVSITPLFETSWQHPQVSKSGVIETRTRINNKSGRAPNNRKGGIAC